MIFSSKFGELLEAVEQLTADEQSELIAIVERRLAAQGRHAMALEAVEGRKEFDAGTAQPSSVDDLVVACFRDID